MQPVPKVTKLAPMSALRTTRRETDVHTVRISLLHLAALMLSPETATGTSPPEGATDADF